MEELNPANISEHHAELDSNTILVILLLIFVFPIGIILMWVLMKHWPKWMKWVITAPPVIILILYTLLFFVLLFVIRPAEQLQKANETKKISQEVQQQYYAQLSATPTPASVDAVIPSDWTYHTSNKCAVALAVPPKKAPYYIPSTGSEPATIDEGKWWKFIDQNLDLDSSQYFTYYTMVKLTDEEIPTLFSETYSTPILYTSGGLSILCGVNENKYTTDEFMLTFHKDWDESVRGWKLIEDGQEIRWGHTVTKFHLENTKGERTDPEYILATPSTIYLITKTSLSTNPFIKSTTDQIFNLLKFP